jgi:urease accessory protein
MLNQQLATANSKLNTMNGELSLTFEKRGSTTRLIKSHHSSPLKASKALYLDDDGRTTVYLMETSGGMVEGDMNNYSILCGNGSEVTLIPQSSTKVYPARFDLACRQNIKVNVEKDAKLTWMPETTIPFEHSIFLANTNIHLQPSSSLVFSEIFSSGRQKSAESFEFTRFSSKTLIYVEDKPIVFDHLDLTKKESPLFQLGMFEEATYMGSIWYIDPDATKREMKAEFPSAKNHRFGWTNLDDYGYHFRWLTTDLCLLKEQMNELINQL